MLKKSLFLTLLAGFILNLYAQTNSLKPVKLEAPDLQRGKNIMEALAERQSTRTFADKKLSPQDLSDLVWAANGINRPESGKRTAPSAMNRQDIKVYVCREEGSYFYNPQTNTLEPLTSGDVRPVKSAPVCIVLVADEATTFGLVDAGIVSQNISLFCSGNRLATYPAASMDKEALKKALKLTGKQEPILQHPVGYFQ